MTDAPDALHGLGAQNTDRALVKTTREGGHARDLMTPAPLTVTPEASIAEVWDTMRELEVRHVPVVQRGALVGMLSDRDFARIDVACWKSRFSFMNAAGLP